MQVTSIPYHTHNTYQKTATNTQETGYTEASESQTNQIDVPQTGFDLTGKINLIYLLKPEDISEFKGEMPDLNNFFSGFKNQDDLAQQYHHKGQQQDIERIVFFDGKAVVSEGYDGTVYGHGPVAEIFKETRNDPQKRQQRIAEQFPDAHIEVYPKGEGPTNAEVFELRYGESYQDYVDEQVRNYSDQYLTNQIAAEENYRRKLMFEQTPQTSVFSVDGQVVASRDDKGFVDVGLPLLDVADARGIEREALKELFRYSPERSPEDYQALLNQVFGDGVELTSYSTADAPKREEVREMAQANGSAYQAM
ncbi:hypothetical protein [Pseudoalteromonas sp. PPB1]|uniref:hypothetical protein n=1 Tax=Pseudoalteromonas sp. PPB1 TaxID=2756136 RepID=UPI001891D16E|nr:hypothetical protein [Pseudoalteromonas sp. PPB1]